MSKPGGWYFEFNNEFYPDVDDSAQVCWRLKLRGRNPRERYQHEVATARAGLDLRDAVQERRMGQLRPRQHQDDLPVHSVCRPQRDARSADGGHYRADSGDAGNYGYTRRDKRVERAIQFVLKEQEPDGSWFGRWGVNYLYGTFLVLRGLEAMGVWSHEPAILQAAEWIRMVQNADGGWGETCGSYDDPLQRGIGPSTPSQTAWAVLGLLAAAIRARTRWPREFAGWSRSR
jgi:squalene-hopene/tetraprenyl-beta-curcumene cyclase